MRKVYAYGMISFMSEDSARGHLSEGNLAALSFCSFLSEDLVRGHFDSSERL